MYFQLPNHIFGASYREDLILLDIFKNKYFSLEEDIGNCLKTALANEFIKKDSFYNLAQNTQFNTSLKHEIKEFNFMLQKLLQENLLEECSFSKRKNFLEEARQPIGLSQLEWWPTEKRSLKEIPKLWVVEAFFTLIRVHFILRYQQIGGLIRFIDNKLNYNNKYYAPSKSQISLLAQALDCACLFYLKKSKCLAWAGTLTILALRRKWKCQLVIGVQSIPFYAHAWVESNGNVINDSYELQERLSPILRVPLTQRDS